jgi:hypothetical protein
VSSKKPQQDNINIYIRTSIYSYLNIGGLLHSIGGGGSIIIGSIIIGGGIVGGGIVGGGIFGISGGGSIIIGSIIIGGGIVGIGGGGGIAGMSRSRY